MVGREVVKWINLTQGLVLGFFKHSNEFSQPVKVLMLS
jgi:hypothetical protein